MCRSRDLPPAARSPEVSLTFSKAIASYLSRFAAAEIGEAARAVRRYAHVVVIPVMAEQASFLAGIKRACASAAGPVLSIVVVNAPETASAAVHEANAALLCALAGARDVMVIDRASPGRRLGGRGGVGMARKIGCDVALALIAQGKVTRPWIHTTDADATLPGDYFFAPERAGDAVAITYPFVHAADARTGDGRALLVYDIAIRAHVLGLRAAGSPYAFHTLGSAMAARADAYAAVRGVPARTGGEDFYLLQKLRKLGPVARARTGPVILACRPSLRVAFGTGPAMARISATHARGEVHRITDPACFALVGRWLALLDDVAEARNPAIARERIAAWKRASGPEFWLATAAEASGAYAAICRDHHNAPTAAAYKKRLSDGFDGLRTLRLVHELAAIGLPDLAWPEAIRRAPYLEAVAHLADPKDPAPLSRALMALEET
ncbi:MAG TPA: hypothetical protein VFG83_08875 [Kofleriaceae bacterium]|nr:hypothetical protein [Kofleriaceae bacterium]